MTRYMLMHKTCPANEAGIMPAPEVIARIHAAIGALMKSGAMLDGAGLRQSSLGVRLRFAGGRRTVSEGPFTGGNELPAALCIMKVRTRDDAVAWATRFAQLLGDAEIDIRPVTEPWDLGFVPRPEGLQTTRFMAVLKADARFESGAFARPSAALKSGVMELIAEMKAAGVFQTAELFQPSRHAKRVRLQGGRQVVIDGPFAESKELISGFLLLRLDSMDEAVTHARSYARALDDAELDIRPLEDLVATPIG